MSWLKMTRNMNGTNTVDMRKPYKTAEECMDSFSRFEKDTSFGVSPCWPIFCPSNDKELEAFKDFLKAVDDGKKPDPTKELAHKLLNLVDALTEHIKKANEEATPCRDH